MRYSSRTRPVPWFTMLVMRPLRRPIFSVTTPTNSSGQSITSFSIGSCRAPFTVRVITSGFPTADLEALAAHGLDQDRHLQLAAARDVNTSGVSPGARAGSR
jgi:hypothetical protein